MTPLSPSMEDYLEAIYELDRVKRAVRVKDVANRLQVKMPSVSSALKNLESLGFIRHERYEYIELTETGIHRASSISMRHSTLREFLVLVGVDVETAESDACKVEHVLSQETMDRISEFVERRGS
jgi:DtxR family transcriptional regulator, Mn-dependent transcriptional regulator